MTRPSEFLFNTDLSIDEISEEQQAAEEQRVLDEQFDDGYIPPDGPMYDDDAYWPGTGELCNDDSYIDYLNRY